MNNNEEEDKPKTPPEKKKPVPTKKAVDTSKEAEEPEFLEGVPDKVKKSVIEFMGMQRFSAGSVAHPLYDKIEGKHIDKMLDIVSGDTKNVHEDKKSTRRYTLTYVIIFVAIFIFLTILLLVIIENVNLYLDILMYIVLLAGGFLGGYGYKSYRERIGGD